MLTKSAGHHSVFPTWALKALVPRTRDLQGTSCENHVMYGGLYQHTKVLLYIYIYLYLYLYKGSAHGPLPIDRTDTDSGNSRMYVMNSDLPWGGNLTSWELYAKWPGEIHLQVNCNEFIFK